MRELDPFDPVAVGPYTLLGQLGAGSMGTVYLGRSAGGRTVAVKLVRAELVHDMAFRERFRREVEAARRVSGAFTAPVVDADTEADVPWLATTFVPSLTLAEAVESAGPLPERTLRALTAGIAEALTAVHTAGLVHRDLKPANVLLALDGPHVIDFGIARAVEASTALTAAGRRLGTASYMAPEQVRGEPVTPAGDVFALGATIAYAARGKDPFGAAGDPGTPGRVLSAEPDLSAVPAGLRLMVAACLVKDPAGRPTPHQIVAFVARDASPQGGAWLPPALTEAVERAAAVLAPAGAADEGPQDPPEPAARPARRRLLLGLAGGAVVLAGGGTALGLALRRGETSHSAERAARLVDPKRSLDTKTVAKPLWTAPLDAALIQLVGAGDTVVAIGESGLQGHDRRTGRRTWGPLANAAEARLLDSGGNPVACADGTVYVLGKAGLGGSTARALRAVDVATGRVLWTGAGPGAGFYTGTMVPGVLGDQVYVTGAYMPMVEAGTTTRKGSSALVWAADRASGDLLWTRTDPGDDPSLGAGIARLFVPSSGTRVLWQTSNPDRSSRRLAALDTTARGKILWEEPSPGGIQSSLNWITSMTATSYDPAHSYAGGFFLYLGDRLYAVEPATGQTAWRSEQRPLPFLAVVVSPDRKTVYAVTRESPTGVVVYAFDAATGDVRWAGSLPSASKTSLQMVLECADDTVYLWVAGRTWALDMADGRARWTFDFVGGATTNDPAPVALWAGSGRLYGTTDNRLVAIAAGNSAAS
jgi:outer membrane protein assembly factor BamB